MFEEHLQKNCPPSHSTVGRTAMYNKDKRIIKLTVSTTAAPFSPIFELENTALMNLISYDRFYCAYPTLTFRGLAMINNGPVTTVTSHPSLVTPAHVYSQSRPHLNTP